MILDEVPLSWDGSVKLTLQMLQISGDVIYFQKYFYLFSKPAKIILCIIFSCVIFRFQLSLDQQYESTIIDMPLFCVAE